MATRYSYSTRGQKGTKIVEVATPTSTTDAANKFYVDSMLTNSAPAAETFSAVAVVGTATTAARADHVHAMPASSGGAALATTTPAAETSGATGAVGTGTTAARSDHVHAMPTIPSSVALATTTPAQVSVTNVGAIGSGTTAARSDHVHGISTVTQFDIRLVTSTTTAITSTDELVLVPTTVSTVQLPAASSLVAGKGFIVKSKGSGVTVTSISGAIDNGLTKSSSIENWGSRTYVSDGTDYWAV